MNRHLHRLFCFPALTLVVLIAALLAGCEHRQSPQVTVRFWNGFTGPDGRTMLRMVRQFNKENPDVNVLMQRMEWSTYYNKLFVAGMGRRAPEVFVVHTRAMVRFAQAHFVRPVDDLVAANHFPIQDIAPNVYRAAEIDGKHYSLPLDVHAMGMYYNRKLFRDAGIVDEKGQARPPRTRAEFLDALRRLTHAPSRKNPDQQWGFVFTNPSAVVYTVMRQSGAQFFTPGGGRCIMNNPANAAALQFCVDLIQKQKVAPPPENFDPWVGFRQGKVGVAFEGIYMLADLEKQKDLDFAGAPVPLIGSTPAVWADSHNLCMRAGLSPEETTAAWRFMRFLSDHSLDWAAGGQIPARTDLRSSPRFKAMSVQAQFAKQIPIVTYMPQMPFIFEFSTEFDAAVEKALRGTATPQAALDLAAANVNKIIERRREDQQLALRSAS